MADKKRGRPVSPAARRAKQVRLLKSRIRRVNTDLLQLGNYVDRYDTPRALDNAATAIENLTKAIRILTKL